MSETKRTPEAEGLEVVLVGSFNPAIFHPEWFLNHGLIGEQDANEAEVVDVSGQITLVRFCGMELQCLGDRFSLGTNNMSLAERLQDLIIRTFTLLSHTPITACGINHRVHYSVISSDYWHQIGHTLAPKQLLWNDLLEEPGMQSLTIKAPRRGGFPGEINLTVEPSARFPPGIFVTANYHYGLPKEVAHSRSAGLALKFINSEWKRASGMARKVGEQIFSKIKPDNV